MALIRLSQLSAPRQCFVRECQQIVYGKILRLLVRDTQPIFDEHTEVLIDLKLDANDSSRPEEHVADFTVSAELTRLFVELDAIRNGVIEHIEVRAGVPRRISFKRLPPTNK
jgi:hypothetical protein